MQQARTIWGRLGDSPDIAVYFGSVLRYVGGNDLELHCAQPVQFDPGALGNGWFKGVVECSGGFIRCVGKHGVWVWVPQLHHEEGQRQVEAGAWVLALF